jgi:ribosomal protein L15
MERAPRGGRGYGRGRTRGGRGNGGRHGSRSTTTNNKFSQTLTKKETKFGPFIPNKAPPATYASVKDAIILHFTKINEHDVADSLEAMSKITLTKPIRILSTKTVKDEQDQEQAGLDIDYSGEMDDYRARKKALDKGMRQAYSIIFTEYCTKEMQTRIEEHRDFMTIIRNDPIELLSAIKLLMHAPSRAQYPLIDWLHGMRRFLLMKQNPEEQLSDYYKKIHPGI